MPPDLAAARARMVERQLRARGVCDARVLAALAAVPRELFLPEAERAHAYDDAAVAIGCGQTMSQPFMVAAICELLGLRGGERVLDVGTGSGYQAAVLAELAAEVVSVERVPELAERARAALAAAGYASVEVRVGDGSLGVPERAPYDAIAVAAAAPAPPPALVAQLGPGGRLAIPVGEREAQRLELHVRSGGRALVTGSVPCRFVPLLGEAGFAE